VAQALDYKCPQCGGNLVYSAEVGLMVCDNCGSRFDPREFQAQPQPPDPAASASAAGAPPQGAPEPVPGETAQAAAAAWPPAQFDQYTCRSCGAVVVAAATEAAGTCPYCRSPIVITQQLEGELAPDLVIPFQTTRDQAVAALTKLYGKKRLLPKVFSAQNFVDEVKGVYVPFWLFDYDIHLIEHYTATDVSTVHMGSRRHITTRKYAADRAGDARFLGIPVDGSVNMPDAIMESVEPFDLTQAVPFEPSYLPGFLAERYDVDSSQAAARAHDRLIKSAGTIFQDTVTGHERVASAGAEVFIKQTRLHYALLPVWMLTTFWRGQRFTFAMNGQTGRMIGDLPLDRQAYWRWFFGLAGASAVVAGLVATLAVSL
jgi:DNA-directed RNA polymerase subunit RPC12/RpoP